MSGQPHDEGFHGERLQLAWHRTSLGIVAMILIIVKILEIDTLPVATTVAVMGIGVVAVAVVERLRVRHSPEKPSLMGVSRQVETPVVIIASLVMCLGGLSLWWVAIRAIGAVG